MQVVLNSMPAWTLLAAIGMLVITKTWRKRRRQMYSRELMQKLARAL